MYLINREAFYTVKGVMFGDSGIGKTTILQRSIGGDLDNLRSTIGADLVRTEYPITMDNHTYNIQVIIWDTAGQEYYKAITGNYARDSHLKFLMCDLSRPDTMKNLPDWMKFAHENSVMSSMGSKINERSIYHIIGNKSDLRTNEELAADRKKLDEVVEQLSAEYKRPIAYSICSAKNARRDDISKLFQGVVSAYFIRNPDGLKEMDEKFQLARGGGQSDQGFKLLDSHYVKDDQKGGTRKCCH